MQQQKTVRTATGNINKDKEKKKKETSVKTHAEATNRISMNSTSY